MSHKMAKDFLNFSKKIKRPITIIIGVWAIGIAIAQCFVTVNESGFNDHGGNVISIIFTYALFIVSIWNGGFPPVDPIDEDSSDGVVFIAWGMMISLFLAFIYTCVKVMGWL